MPGADQRQSPLSRPVPLTHVIETHLEKILASEVFTTADSLRRLLRFVVNEAVAGRGEDVKEYSLAVAVLGRDDSFDPKADPIVRVQMLRLREHLARYYAADGRHDALMIDIPKGRYMPAFRAGASATATAVATVEEDMLAVGHEKELLALRSAFESAAGGRGRMVCLAGEPGIGKTTVVEVFLRQLAATGVPCRIARGRCAEQLIGSDAYLAVLDALEGLMRGDEVVRREIRDTAPSWYVQLAPRVADAAAAPTPPDEAVASRERLKRELTALLRSLARERPLVLFLDDLHWADPSTVDALAYVAPRCAGDRILIAGTFRSAGLAAINPAFLAMKLELQGHDVCRELPMTLLSRTDVDRCIDLQFEDHRFPPELGARIHDRTEGNPLFVADLLRFLRDRGVIARRDGCWVLAGELDAVERDLPESVRSMVQKKIGGVAEDDRALMSAAAVLGPRFESAVLARALAMEPDTVEARLMMLDRDGDLVRLAAERLMHGATFTLEYGFVHVLYQEALLDAVTPSRKAALGRSLADALVALYGPSASDAAASRIALLFEAGRDFARASDFFLHASRNAARLYATAQAIALARRAIANAGQLEGAERDRRVMVAALHCAEQQQAATELDEAIADYETCEAAARALDDSAAQIDALFGQATVCFLAKRIPEIRIRGDRAMAIARAAGLPVPIAASTAILAMEGLCSGDVAAAERQFDEAIPVLQAHGVESHALKATLMRGLLHTWRLDHHKAERDLEWSLQRAGRRHSNYEILIGFWHTARTRGNQGRLSDASEQLDEALRLADLLGDRYWRPRIENTRGWLRAELLDTEAALRMDTNAVLIAREVGDFEAESHSHVNAARDYLALEDPAAAWTHLEQAQHGYRVNKWFGWVYEPRLQGEMASYWLARNDLQQAARCARVSLEDARRTTCRKRIAWGHRLLGDIAMREDRPADATREFHAALAVLDGYACPTIEWRILADAARAAAALHDDEQRRELLARAARVVQSLAASVRDARLRAAFLHSRPVRDLVNAGGR